MDSKYNIQKFIDKLEIQDVMIIDDDKDFYKEYKNNTLRVLNEIKYTEIIKDANFKTEFLNEFTKLRDRIMSIYRNYVKGNLQTASTQMYNILFNKKYYGKRFYRYFLSSVSEGEKLYRCRNVEKEQKSKEENNIPYSIFHVPFTQRKYVANSRFSISGFPCLYLGSSKTCCKEEIGLARENKENFICYSFILEKDYLCYNFVLDTTINTLKDLQIFLLKYLIIHATAYTVINNENSKPIFHTYYVIPQLITAAIVSKDKEKCICYHSTKFPKDRGQKNYVFIPQINYYKDDIKYDEDLMKHFKIEKC